ncbi:MAG TPA: hypothetical protein VFO60_02870, partial [Candidatus Dormibacteraeota bacterium]|nr:hypothetical protein [Candidatus Dormibacteraeota bacterium]
MLRPRHRRESGQALILAMALIAVFAVVTVSIARFGDVTFLQQMRTENTARSDSLLEGAAAFSVADANRQDWSCFGFPAASVTMTDGTTVGYATRSCVPTSFGRRFEKLPCSLCALSPSAGQSGIVSRISVALPDPGAAIITNSSLTLSTSRCPVIFAANAGIQYQASAGAPLSSGAATYGEANVAGAADGTTANAGATISSASLFSGGASYLGWTVADSECNLSGSQPTSITSEDNARRSAGIAPKASAASSNDTFTLTHPAPPAARAGLLVDPLQSLPSPLASGLLAGLPDSGSPTPSGGAPGSACVFSVSCIK